MKLKRLLIVMLGCAGLLAAQDRDGGSIVPPDPARALRQYLNLTQAQVEALIQVQESRREAEQAIYQEMREKQMELEDLLRSGSSDYARIGLLFAEIRELQTKVPITGEPYRSQALAVLTEEQRGQLPALVEALERQAPANEAVMMNLIDRPEGHFFPMPIIPAVTAVTRQ
jgi:Spy/CpxP family protein refolding chaperone